MNGLGISNNSNSNNNTGGNGGLGEETFVDVWAKNMDEQFDRIRQLVQKYPYVAMVSDMYVCSVCVCVCVAKPWEADKYTFVLQTL